MEKKSAKGKGHTQTHVRALGEAGSVVVVRPFAGADGISVAYATSPYYEGWLRRVRVGMASSLVSVSVVVGSESSQLFRGEEGDEHGVGGCER